MKLKFLNLLFLLAVTAAVSCSVPNADEGDNKLCIGKVSESWFEESGDLIIKIDEAQNFYVNRALQNGFTATDAVDILNQEVEIKYADHIFSKIFNKHHVYELTISRTDSVFYSEY